MEKPSLQQALASGGLSTRADILKLVFTDPAFVIGTFGFAIVPLFLQVCLHAPCYFLFGCKEVHSKNRLDLD